MSNLAPCPGCGSLESTDDDYVLGGDPSLPQVLYRWQCRCGWWGPEAQTLVDARAAWNLRAPALRWRREPPDAPGWWWHRRVGANADLVYCDVASVEWHASHVARAGAEWAGPIPEPAEPEA